MNGNIGTPAADEAHYVLRGQDITLNSENGLVFNLVTIPVFLSWEQPDFVSCGRNKIRNASPGNLPKIVESHSVIYAFTAVIVRCKDHF